jgi:hypothetical protein
MNVLVMILHYKKKIKIMILQQKYNIQIVEKKKILFGCIVQILKISRTIMDTIKINW